MEIKVVSKIKFILYIAIPFAVIYLFSILYMIIEQIAGHTDIFDEPWRVIQCVIILIFLVVFFIYLKRHIFPSYLFTNDNIYIYEKMGLKDKIDVANIGYMHCYPYRVVGLLTIGFRALKEGEPMEIQIKEKDGTYHALRFIEKKDAKMLQKILYPDILSIFDHRGQKS